MILGGVGGGASTKEDCPNKLFVMEKKIINVKNNFSVFIVKKLKEQYYKKKIKNTLYCKTSNIALAFNKHSSYSFEGSDKEVMALPTEKETY